MSLSAILLCSCANARVVPAERVNAVRQRLREANQSILEVADLCALAAQKDPLLLQLAQDHQQVRIAACYPRAVLGLLATAGVALPEARTRIANLRLQSAEEAVALLAQDVELETKLSGPAPETRPGDTNPTTSPAPGQEAVGGPWQAWFPVIDFERCTQCLQCLSFCLFGVYGVDAQHRIQVQHPEQCKTNCPACSRVCPEVAIMFPKFSQGPINGAPVPPNAVQPERVKVDISTLLGGDVYERLRERGARARFDKERDAQTARRERQKHLAKLSELGIIPPEVWNSLPSAEEIERLAEQAQARARSARPSKE